MDKKLLVCGIIVFLLAVSLSGCNENLETIPNNESPDEQQESSEGENNSNIEQNHAPLTPNLPYGPTSGYVGVEYTYLQSTTELDGDEVSYRFDWGDGSYSDWSSLMEHQLSFSQTHAWASVGTYEIKIMAKDEYGETSNWSAPLTVEIIDTGSQEIIFPSIASCYPQAGFQVGLSPNLRTSVQWWNAPADYDVPDTFLTWSIKQDGAWIEVKNIQIISGGNHYYQYDGADEYSTTYYWKVRLSDEHGTIYSEISSSFITIPNTMPMISIVGPCNWWDAELQPMLSVEIYDQYGDKMDLTWYEKHDDAWMITQIDQSLTNGTYHYTYDNADEYDTRYDWKVRVTDEYGEYMERECMFHTKSPKITISNVVPLDGTTFYIYLNNGGTSSVTSPLNFSAMISNSEGHQMDIEFVYYSQTTGTVTNTTQNVYNGTYSWNPTGKLLYYGDSPRFYVKVTDIDWGKHTTSNVHHFNIKRAWVQFSQDEANNSLTVTYIEPSNLSWHEIGIFGIGYGPSGIISVGDKITGCSGTVSLYWSAVDFLIDTWTFT